MNWQTAPQTLLLVSLPLGLLFTLLHWGLYDMPLTLGNVATHLVVAMVYAIWQLRSNAWFAKLRDNDYARWRRVAAGGQLRFLFAYGLASKGMALACLMVGMNWAYSGAIPTSERLMSDGMVWSILGVWFARNDWKRMQRGAGLEP